MAVSFPPVTREEAYIAKISGADVAIPYVPLTRLEMYYAKIAGQDVTIPAPVTREELYLAKIAGENAQIPDHPVTRREFYLAALAGENVEPPAPVVRCEMFMADWLENGGDELVSVTGTAPLSLPNAVAKPITSLIQYGKCEQSGTPTPASPVPIKCNNGELKMVHQSGLPSDYKLLEYVGGSGSQYIVTDLYLASTDVVECEYSNSSTTGYGAIYGIYKSGESTALYGNQTYYGYNEGNSKVDTGVSVDTDWHSSRHDFVNGTLTIDDITVNFTPWTFVNTTKNAVLTRFYNGSYGYHWKGYVRKFKVTRGSTVVCDLLPAKDSNDDAGLYDLVSGNFYTASGGTLLEGNVVDDYYLAVVGTPEVLTIGAQTASAVNLYGIGTAGDTQDFISGDIARNYGLLILDGTQSWTCTNMGDYWRANTSLSDLPSSGSGGLVCTHFIGVKQAAAGYAYYSSGKLYLCDTDKKTCNSSANLNAFLAAQLAAGTPVVVVYPKKTPTTESVAPQPLSTAQGDNTVAITAAVSSIKLDAQYNARPE